MHLAYDVSLCKPTPASAWLAFGLPSLHPRNCMLRRSCPSIEGNEFDSAMYACRS